MWPYIRKTESVAELKMKFTGNQNVKNGVGVSGKPTRAPRTGTSVTNGMLKTAEAKLNAKIDRTKKVNADYCIFVQVLYPSTSVRCLLIRMCVSVFRVGKFGIFDEEKKNRRIK